MPKQWPEIEHYRRETPKAKELVKITGADSEGLGLMLVRVLAPTRNPSNTIGEERREEKRRGEKHLLLCGSEVVCYVN